MNVRPYVGMPDTNLNNINNLLNNSSTSLSNNLVSSNSTNVESFDLSDAIFDGAESAITLIAGTRATGKILKWKVVAGCYDTLEKIGDGALNLMIGDLAMPTVDQLIYQDFDGGAESQRFSNWLKEDISINYVKGIENEIYNNTEYGRRLNNNSFIKWDSEIAAFSESISYAVTDAVGAGAATMASGGAVSPLVLGLGYLEGSGAAAEETYQRTFDTTMADQAGMVFSGAIGAIKWWALGRTAQGAVNLSNQIQYRPSTSSSLGSNTYGEAIRKLWQTHRHRGLGNFLKRTLKITFTRPDNIADMASSAFQEISSTLNSGESITAQTYKNAGVSVLKDTSINLLLAGASTSVGTLRTPLTTSIDAKTINLSSILTELVGDLQDADVNLNNEEE